MALKNNRTIINDGGGAGKTLPDLLTQIASRSKSNSGTQPINQPGTYGRSRTYAPGSASVAVNKEKTVAPTIQNGVTYMPASGRPIVSPALNTGVSGAASALIVGAMTPAVKTVQPKVPNAVVQGAGSSSGGGSGDGVASTTPAVQSKSAADYVAELEGSRPGYEASDYVTQLLASLQQAEGARPGEYVPSDAANELLARLQQTEGSAPGAYKPSEAVRAALEQLNALEGNKPTYTNTYEDRINGMLDQILNRKGFEYDFNADPMYRQFAQKYQEDGRQAMMDTMGQAAAMTGGYGNSYAQAVGQQAYQQNLRELNDVIPQLRDAAYQMYVDEGNNLRNNMQLLRDLEGTDYGRYRDDVGDYYADLNYRYGRYRDEADTDYSRYSDEVQRYQNDRNYDYNRYADQSDRDYRLWQAAMDQFDADRAYAADRYDTESNREYSRYLDDVDRWESDLDYWNRKAQIEAAQAAAEAAARSGGGGGGNSAKKSTVSYASLDKLADSYGLEYDDIAEAVQSGAITEMQADVLGKKVENQKKELYATPQKQTKEQEDAEIARYLADLNRINR